MTKNELLKRYFGYDNFRPGQERLIEHILGGGDAFGIMPTGAGKSVCYQIPAMMTEGITIVISPLISLMKDQVSSLNQAGIHAAYLNSSLTPGQYYKALGLAAQGRYKLIYVAPERLMSREFLDFAVRSPISIVAVDEAHCVSQWGQDFRPGYLKISDFISKLERRPVVCAFTATATKAVREDIIRLLKLREPYVMMTGFDRKNLYFSVEKPKNKYAAVKKYIEAHPSDSGIVYCLTRKQVEDVCGQLTADGYRATRYHAGLSDRERIENQDDFIYDRCPIMVATNAFGMGIDKSDVRYVLHYNMPKNMESYYQEAGRAGRDGEPAECILYYSGQDVITNQLFIENNRDNDALDDETRAAVTAMDFERLRKMNIYCQTSRCLRSYILNYFGEESGDFCGRCGNCLTEFTQTDVTAECTSIAGLVRSCFGRYGMNVLLDTLRGAKSAKVRQYRLEDNSYYGVLAKTSAARLKEIFNFMLAEGYLKLTDDSYMLVKLTPKTAELFDGTAKAVMKTAVSENKQRQEKSERSKKGAPAALSEKDIPLFEALRSLRQRIAKEEGVPPYIVFSDKTLVHLCEIRPKTKDEMMLVSGIGTYKLEKYGERFLELVKKNQT